MKWKLTLHFDAPDAPGGRDSEQYGDLSSSEARSLIRGWMRYETGTNPVIIMEAE